MFHSSTGSRLYLLAALVALLALAGCATLEQEVTVFQDEEWKSSMHVGVSSAMIGMSGGEEMLTSEMESAKAEAEALGAELDWKTNQGDDGNIYYTITASGQGYALLNQIAFDNDAFIEPIVYDGEDAIQFQYSSDGDLASYEMHLHTGEILESNGFQEGRGNVTWEGVGTDMVAIFRPKSSFPLLPLVGGLAAVVIAVAAFLFLQAWRRRQSQAANVAYADTFTSPTAPSTSVEFCHQCGKRIEIAGKFCPHCGALRL